MEKVSLSDFRKQISTLRCSEDKVAILVRNGVRHEVAVRIVTGLHASLD
jgi:hypothetical protein